MERNLISACDFLRHTETGVLCSRLIQLTDELTVRCNDAEIFSAEEGSLVLVVSTGRTREDVVQRLLDWAELGLHAGWSARVDGSAIRSVFDIRTSLARKDVGEDPIPF